MGGYVVITHAHNDQRMERMFDRSFYRYADGSVDSPCTIDDLFALKVQGVRWLRFHADRRACLAFTLVIGLVHLDCIKPGLEQKIPIDCTAVLTTTVLAVFTLRVSRTLSDALKHGHAHKTIRSIMPVSSNTIWYDAFHPHCWILTNRNVVSRAPPA